MKRLVFARWIALLMVLAVVSGCKVVSDDVLADLIPITSTQAAPAGEVATATPFQAGPAATDTQLPFPTPEIVTVLPGADQPEVGQSAGIVQPTATSATVNLPLIQGPETAAQATEPAQSSQAGVVLYMPLIFRNSSGYPYNLQPGLPAYIPNFARPDQGCATQSVAGQVFGRDGTPVTLLVVHVQGVLNGQYVDVLGMTGQSPAYGPGGYEVVLGSAPYASTGTLTIYVTELNGTLLTAKTSFDTFADCQKNVTILNFFQ